MKRLCNGICRAERRGSTTDLSPDGARCRANGAPSEMEWGPKKNLRRVTCVPYRGRRRVGSASMGRQNYEKLGKESSIANHGQVDFDVSQIELARFDGGRRRGSSGGPPDSTSAERHEGIFGKGSARSITPVCRLAPVRWRS